jgi:hypothetical protein
MELQFYRENVEKYSNIKFNENPSGGAELFRADRQTDGRTDEHDEGNSRFSQFCEPVQKLRKMISQ